ncbi:sensor domain-containing phosphodiesterase [Mycolicibacterium komossense]|uniref:EAL domain-containing protein n=1 Tax=Mycolicibacterium komossense TaxID=1779 RepID=A0ABT3CAT3_9MYCO|nr:EAL domain-containing protein [Mycolicibacterium komossense]MCV7226584.1 EAL domain-containing protein [Mycolicibacterium komossense]
MGDRLAAATQGAGLVPVLQPIIALPAETVVGFEALARWPSLNNPHPPDVFAYASATGQLDELDQRCIEAAMRAALARRLPRGTLLAVNSEPESAYVGPADSDALASGRAELAVMFELTERNLLTHPRALLAKVAALRRDGFAIALDDVGAHPDSLALLDVVSPDVIKLDLHLVQSQPRRDQTRILAAVLAHHERSGAEILAEGIETDAHLEQALALGATLCQGYKYPDLGPGNESHPWSPSTQHPPAQIVTGSPFGLLTSNRELRTGRKKTLTAFSRHIEDQASYTADPPMVLATLQQAENFTAATRRRYLDLAQTSPLVAMFGEHLPPCLEPKIRGVHLSQTDPLRAEWTVLALGAQLSVALIARERADVENERRADDDRRFDFTITYDRSLVTAVARNLLGRMS